MGPHDNNNEVRNHVHHVGVNRPINIITPYRNRVYVCFRVVRVYEMDKEPNKMMLLLLLLWLRLPNYNGNTKLYATKDI